MEFSEIAKASCRLAVKKIESYASLFSSRITPLPQSATYRVRDLLAQIEDKVLKLTTKTQVNSRQRLLVRWNECFAASEVFGMGD
jgi:hypothetical protein